MTQQGPQASSDLTRAFLVGYASVAAVLIQLTRLALSTGASNDSPSQANSARSMKSRWANRLVRLAISQEINELSRRGIPLPLLGPQHGAALTPLNLPSDPAHNYYGRSGSSQESCAKPSSDSRRRKGVGLPPRKVCIVGAGIAGLYIAMILDDLQIPNLEYEILEASERIGGRAYTHHFSDEKHNYYDVGAMRYPNIPTMERVFDLFRRTEVPLLRYCLHGGESCPHLFNDRLMVAGERDSCRVGVANGGMVPDDVVDGVDRVLDKAFGPYKTLLTDDFEAGFEKLMTVDNFSTREFLRSGGPDGAERRHGFHAVQWMETQNTSTGLFEQAFSESVMDSFDFDDASGDIDWYCIDGGTSELVQRIQRGLVTKPETNKRVRAIHINRSNSADGNMSVHVAEEAEARSGYSAVFSTTTLGCLLKMDTSSLDLHPVQKNAIRTLHYDESAKVALQFSYPWWIVDCGIRTGGTSSTDLPLRTCIYPSYNLNDGHDKPAILLASYTWAQDAIRLGSMISNATDEGSTQPRVPAPSEEELIDLILRDLARLHAGKMTYEKLRAAFTGVYHAWAWQNDPFTAGAFAFYSPGQFSHLYPYLTRPAADSKFHIVGEAASAHHGWVAGSLNSAYGAVFRFLYRYRLWEYMAIMEERWGSMDEIEHGEHGTVHLQVALGMLTRDRNGTV